MSSRSFAEPGEEGERQTRRVALLGSTGSIGRQAIEVLAAHPEAFTLVALAAGSNTPLLQEQAARLRPSAVALGDPSALAGLDLPPGTERVGGVDALEALATRDDVDLVIVATGGVVSLRPVVAALRAGKVVATANKETLVAGGHLVMPLARDLAGRVAKARPGDPFASALAWLRPIDSEHSAIWQCLVGERMDRVAALILTASGGPFLDATPATLAAVTPAQALRHPTWTMGAKITIDSSTLMNKGLEVIEAHELFGIDFDRIEVVVHPQSIVHSMVEFTDGSTLAQASPPDMRIPIALAMAWPDRVADAAAACDWTKASTWEFFPLDEAAFPAVGLAKQVGRAGGTYPAVFNGANEACVSAFLAGRLPFTGIVDTVAAVVAEHADRAESGNPTTLEAVLDADRWSRARAEELTLAVAARQ
jgi:1-deoxy-D-xylulose-5-phosphate reductoisomerase